MVVNQPGKPRPSGMKIDLIRNGFIIRVGISGAEENPGKKRDAVLKEIHETLKKIAEKHKLELYGSGVKRWKRM